VQLGHGAAQRRIWTAETEHTSAIAEGIASDKDLTKTLLSCGVPVPEGELVPAPKRPGKRRRTSACRWCEALRRQPWPRRFAQPEHADIAAAYDLAALRAIAAA
jgi:hypothetical protein